MWAPSSTHWFFSTRRDTPTVSGSATELPCSLKLLSVLTIKHRVKTHIGIFHEWTKRTLSRRTFYLGWEELNSLWVPPAELQERSYVPSEQSGSDREPRPLHLDWPSWKLYKIMTPVARFRLSYVINCHWSEEGSVCAYAPWKSVWSSLQALSHTSLEFECFRIRSTMLKWMPSDSSRALILPKATKTYKRSDSWETSLIKKKHT